MKFRTWRKPTPNFTVWFTMLETSKTTSPGTWWSGELKKTKKGKIEKKRTDSRTDEHSRHSRWLSFAGMDSKDRLPWNGIRVPFCGIGRCARERRQETGPEVLNGSIPESDKYHIFRSRFFFSKKKKKKLLQLKFNINH